jgi:hypothetical protein
MKRGARPIKTVPDPRPATVDGESPALEFSGLHKAFGETVAVDHVDLVVP